MSTFLFVLVSLLAPEAALPAPKPDAAQVKDLVSKIQRFYDTTKDLHAKFEQQIESSIGSTKRASGDVWLKKGGKMRWDYAKPEKKLMVADGTTLWVHEPEDSQAFKQDLRGSTMPLSVSVLIGEGKLDKEFDIVGSDVPVAAGEAALQLTPRQPTGAFRYLVFVVDAASGQVKQTIIVDQQGGKNRMTFSAVETNKGVEDSKFRFSPPSGTKIIQPK